MRIGFDAKKAVKNLTGIGNYSRGLINGLCSYAPEHQYFLFAAEPVNDKAMKRIVNSPALHYSLYPSKKPVFLQEYRKCRSIAGALKSERIDLFHGLTNELPWGIQKTGIPSVVTIHDLIFLRFPETYDLLSRLILKWKTLYACRHADKIIAISRQTKRDIIDFYHIPESKIEVVYQGCDKIFSRTVSIEEKQAIRKRYGIPDRYLLSVGTFEHRKNHRSILQALPLMHDEDIHLVLVGKHTKFQSCIEERVRNLGLQGRVHILNNVPNADLPALYQGCSVFLYMSYFEGFGIPVLEALTSGVPVVAAAGSCLEEAGGDASLYCNPFDYQKIAELTDSILESPERATYMAEQGKEYARNFSEKRIMQSLLNVYRQVLQS